MITDKVYPINNSKLVIFFTVMRCVLSLKKNCKRLVIV